jgi:threonine/homoserine/homoserine lactone efflux protein
MTPTLFLTVIALHVMAAISPGPSFVVSVRVAVSEGFRPALGVAFGFGLGASIWAGAALAGLAALFAVAPLALSVLKWLGAAFLLWLAVQMWRHAREPIATPELGAMPRGILSAIRLGLTTQLANPKAAVFFGAVFAGLVPPDTPLPVLGALLAAILVNETLWYAVVARLFSAARARAVYARIKTGIDRAFGGLLAALAAKIAIG